MKSRLIKGHMTPVSQLALTFNWSLQKMFPLKKVGIEELFSQISISYIRLGSVVYLPRIAIGICTKYNAFVCLKIRIRPISEGIYGSNRFFDMITDETFGHKVKVHENLFSMHGNRKTG